MQNKLTSILFLAYDTTQVMRNVTQRSLSTILQYTNEEDYELIFLDVIPKDCESLWWNKHYEDKFFKFNEHKNRKRITWYERDKPDPGQYACYNYLATLAKGEYLCFFQNDLFVTEGWLESLRYYLENDMADVIFPDQWPRERAFILESRTLDPNSAEAMSGAKDAGMLYLTRKEFDRVGGWDEELKVHYGEAGMYLKLGRQITTRKTTITHLEHGAGWARSVANKEKYDKDVLSSQERVRPEEGK